MSRDLRVPRVLPHRAICRGGMAAENGAYCQRTGRCGENVQDFACMPGPWGIPLLGSALSLGSNDPRLLMEWGDQYYGEVFRYKILTQDYVVLNGYESICEALVKNGDKLSGRVSSPLVESSRKNKGLFFIDYGELWKKWKPFAVKAMSEVAKGISTKICVQARNLLTDMANQGFEDGAALNIKCLLRYRMAQIAFLSFMNKEFDDKNILEDVITDVYASFRSKYIVFLLFSSSWFAIIPPIQRYLATENTRREALVDKLVNWIEEQRGSMTEPSFSDVASIFFRENHNPGKDDMEQLAILVIDWVFAGTLTTTEQTLWVLLFLLKHPNALNKVKIEVQRAFTKVENVDELYRNTDLVPYLMACIQEGVRLRPIAPTALFHKTVEEAVVGGYKIPKDVTIVPNIWSVHYDPKLWSPDPSSFRPERHLSSDGSFMRSKYVIPFGIGGRKCAGQNVAEANIFIFLASLLSKYDVKLAPESENVDLDGVFGSILKTNDFKIIGKKIKID